MIEVNGTLCPARLLKFEEFFRCLIAFAHEVSHDIRVLLIDQNSYGLRPILDAHRQYSKVMARFFCFLIAFEDNACFNRMLSDEEKSAILLMKSADCPLEQFNSHIRPIWLICVSQPVSSNRHDLIKLFIKFQCFSSYIICNEEAVPNLARPAEVEQITAKMMYFCRLYHVARVKWSVGGNAGFREVIDEMLLITANVETPLKRLFFLKGRARQFARSDLVKAKLVSTDDIKCYIINGKRFHLDDICRIAAALLKKLSKEIDILAVGINWPKMNLRISDDLSNGVSNFGFHASCKNERGVILKNIISNNDLKIRCIESINGDEILFTETFASEYIYHHRKAMDYLLALIHITSGMPGRASEVCRAKMINSNGMRNLFFLDKKFVLHTMFNKTNSLTDSNKPVFRFIAGIMTKHVAALLLLIRPLYSIVHHQVYRDDIWFKANSTYLFPCRTGSISPAQYCRVFASCCREVLTFDLLISEWRHLAKRFAKIFLNTSSFSHFKLNQFFSVEDNDEDDEYLAEDLQAGHSTDTATFVYGRLTNNLIGNDYVMEEFKKLSLDWQKLLKVGSFDDITESIEPGSEEEGVTTMDGQVLSALDTDSLVSYVQSRTLLQQLISLTRFQSFKSEPQRYACELAILTKQNLIVVLPTGGGKSLVFSFYALKMQSRFLTLIIVPTNALKDQVVNDLSGMNLIVDSGFSNAGKVNVIVMTPDQVVEAGNRSRIKEMIAGGRIHRVFIDEAHSVCHDAEYRNSFNGLLFLAKTTVSLTFLSATMSLGTIEFLKSRFGMNARRFVHISERINCKNIYLSISKNASVNELQNRVRTFLQERSESERCIIYAYSKLLVIRLLSELTSSLGEYFESFTGGMSDSERAEAVYFWSSGRNPVMIATSAFGLGINFPSVRLVVNFGLPYNLDEYVQQIGRCGRDGRASHAMLMCLEESEDNHSASSEMARFAANTEVCLQRCISLKFCNDAFDCAGLDSIPCFVCSSGGGFVPLQSKYIINDGYGSNADGMIRKENRSAIRHVPKKLKEQFFDDLDKYEGFCVFCAIFFRKRVVHGTLKQNCPAREERCFRCLGKNHMASGCLFSWPIVDFDSESIICSECWLRKQEAHGLDDRCRFKDVLKIFFAYSHLADSIGSKSFFELTEARQLQKKNWLKSCIQIQDETNQLWQDFIEFSDRHPFQSAIMGTPASFKLDQIGISVQAGNIAPMPSATLSAPVHQLNQNQREEDLGIAIQSSGTIGVAPFNFDKLVDCMLDYGNCCLFCAFFARKKTNSHRAGESGCSKEGYCIRCFRNHHVKACKYYWPYYNSAHYIHFCCLTSNSFQKLPEHCKKDQSCNRGEVLKAFLAFTVVRKTEDIQKAVADVKACVETWLNLKNKVWIDFLEFASRPENKLLEVV
jgi:superfamily II DNA/RNA helicase